MQNRTILTTTTLIESNGTPDQHERTVAWVANQLKTSTNYVKGDVFVATHPRGDDGKSYGMSGSGSSPSGETKEIIEDLFGM